MRTIKISIILSGQHLLNFCRPMAATLIAQIYNLTASHNASIVQIRSSGKNDWPFLAIMFESPGDPIALYLIKYTTQEPYYKTLCQWQTTSSTN